MKKLMTLALGLSFLAATGTVAFAHDDSKMSDTTKTKAPKKVKKSKVKKTDTKTT